VSLRTGLRQSLGAAARHLLRHVRDAKELRRNPLASSFFESDLARDNFILVPSSDVEAVGRFHREIHTILNNIKQKPRSRSTDPGLIRGVQIVERCVLQRESSHVVALDLGVSMRQFARDKAKIGSMIARSLMARSTVGLGAKVGDITIAAVNACIAAAERGDGDSALSQLFELAAEANDVLPRASILSIAAQVGHSYGRFSAAAECARRLNESLAVEATDNRNHACARALLSLIEAQADPEQDIDGRGTSLIRQAIQRLRASATEGVPGSYLQLGQALTELGERFADQGLFEQAEGHLTESLLLTSTVSNISSAFEARGRNLLALVLMAQGKHGRRLDECNARSQALAVREGLLNQLACVLMQRAQLASVNGNLQDAARLALESLEAIRKANSNAAVAGVAVAVASLRSATKPLESVTDASTVELLRRSLTALPPGCGNWTWGHVQLADIYLLRNRLRAAMAHAKAADAAAQAMRPPRERARTLRCLAEVEARLGNSDRAKELIVACIEVAEHHERPRWLARHYAVAARLTGDARYSRLGTALRRNARSAHRRVG